jgi:hypothetical protein
METFIKESPIMPYSSNPESPMKESPIMSYSSNLESPIMDTAIKYGNWHKQSEKEINGMSPIRKQKTQLINYIKYNVAFKLGSIQLHI